jgi:superkiller protein 3
MSENSNSSDMPANSESVSEAAESEQPAKLMVPQKENDEAKPAGRMKLQSSTPKYDEPETAENGSKAPKVAKAKSKAAKDEDKDEPSQDDRESAANAYMSHDDSGEHVDPLVYYQAGVRFMKLKKYQLALDSFSKALELNPKYYEASYRKAQVYQLTGYDKYAARRYQDVLKFRPDMDEARFNLAALHRKHKHYTGAEEQLEAVIQHNWASFEAHYNLANVYVEDNKFEDALKEYKFCLKMRPNNPNLHNNLGVLFLQKNYPDEALQEFRKASALSPRNQMFLTNITTASKQIAAKKAKGLQM